MPKLTVTTAAGERIDFDIAGSALTLGRNADNTIVLDEASISGQHAEFKETSRGYVLTDLDSTNGTLVNGNPARETILAHGDDVQFGTVLGVFATEEGAAQPQPEESEPVEVHSAEPVAALGDSSERPADFSSISPFPKKRKKKDPVGMIFLLIGVLAIITAITAAALSAVMKAV